MPEFESQQKATPFSLFSQPVIILGLVCLFSIFLTRADSFVFPVQVSVVHEPFQDLSLPIPGIYVHTLTRVSTTW